MPSVDDLLRQAFEPRDDEWVRRLSDEDARTLLDIFEAMRRVDRGTYGICVQCGSTIDLERLSARPEAAACQVCAMFAGAMAAAQ